MNVDEGLDFEPIVEVLKKHRVAYVVIGGVAGMLHGADLPRTYDLDITPASDAANKKRLAAALRQLEAKLRAPGTEERFEIPLDEHTFDHMLTMTFTTRFGPLDVSFTPDGTEGYEDLKAGAELVDSAGGQVWVASLADVVRSKKAAGRAKDAEHLEILLRYLESPQ